MTARLAVEAALLLADSPGPQSAQPHSAQPQAAGRWPVRGWAAGHAVRHAGGGGCV